MLRPLETRKNKKEVENMAEPTLIRVDFRLFHGMIAMKWSRDLNIKHTYILDDGVVENEMLRQIFTMSKPDGMTMDFFSLEDAAEKWKEGFFEECGGRKMVLLKTIYSVEKLLDSGVSINKLIVGNMESAPKKKGIKRVFFMDETDARTLDKIAQSGTEILFRQLPEDKPVTWQEIRSKNFKKL